MIRKFAAALSLIASVFLVATPLASAHVIVSPKSAQTAQTVTFSISVPNERQVAMTGLKLAVPSGVAEVVPTVMPGWTIGTEKSGDIVTAITWNGGSIPAGQRADFTFEAQTPEKAGQLAWRAYQTYADGTVVSWDQTPTANEADNDAATSGPYSVTNVSSEAPATAQSGSSSGSGVATAALGLSLLALILSIISLVRRPSR